MSDLKELYKKMYANVQEPEQRPEGDDDAMDQDEPAVSGFNSESVAILNL